jgi:PAS domain S-box-containing protein
MRQKTSRRKKSRKPSRTTARPRTRTEKDLLDAKQRLESVLFANEVATWTWDIVNDRVIADRNLATLFGVSPKDAAGGPIEKYIHAVHPDDRAALSAAIAKALEGPDDRFEESYRIVRRNGSLSWVEARGKVERDRKGKPRYFPGVVIDLTDRKASERKADDLRFRLERQSRIFDITLSSISDFAYIFDRQGRFSFVNQALLDLWGLKLQDAIGKNFHDLKYPPDLAKRLQKQIQQVFDTKQGLTDETPYTSPTGAGGYYEYIFRPVFDRGGNVEVVAGSTRDITHRKKTEEDLRQSQERYRVLADSLENQVRARTAELEARSNDMQAQSSQLQALSARLMELQDEERRRIARELHDSAGQIIAALSMNLGKMVEELKVKESSLVELAEESQAYAQELDREIRTTSYLLHPPLLDEIGLRAALDWYVDGLKQRSGLDVALNIQGGFERPSREMELAIFRVVQECLVNIHRHSGSTTARIRIAREGSNVVVEVSDDGRGIDSDKLAKLRARSTGVGLRGIRERVRQFCGDLHIDSEVDKGTAVRIIFPIFAEN